MQSAADRSDERAGEEKCWFCESAPAESAAAAPVEMHSGGFPSKGREYLVQDSMTLRVPRCVGCKAVHDRVEGRVAKGGVAGLLVGVAACLVLLWEVGFDLVLDLWKPLLIAVALFGMAGGVLAWFLGSRRMPAGVKDQRAREHHPAVRRKLDEGWVIGPKPPGL